MTEAEVKNAVLLYLYNHEKSGDKSSVSISRIAATIPESDKKQICRIAEALKKSGWIKFSEFIGDDGVITYCDSVVCDYVEKNLLEEHNLKASISQVRELAAGYEAILNSGKDVANLAPSLNAFRQWHKAASVLFGRYFNISNPDMKAFKDMDCSGNGYRLRDEYESVAGNVAVLLDQLEHPQNGSSKDGATMRELSKDIFIVHGHDNEMKNAVKNLLFKLGLNPIILGEQPNGGRTVIEKFEDNSQRVDFAVVLMSDKDDMGAEVGSIDYKPRARQNVILELGYFIGRLGRKKHVCVLKKSDVEEPSDILGVVYTKYESGSIAWQYELADELKEAGFAIDKNVI